MNSVLKNSLFVFVLIFFTSISIAQIKSSQRNIEITPSEIQIHINYLASDALKGRATGTPEADLTVKYLTNEFKHYGLKPLFGKSYKQEFTFTADVELTKMNSIIFTSESKKQVLKLNDDFITASFSGNGKVTGELVFVGYGITAPKLKYDDYEGIDVKDKIVVVLRYNPEFDNPHTQFEEYSSFRFKAALAKEKGAKGIIFINGFYPELDSDNLMKFVYDRAAGVKDFPVVHIKRNYIDEIFKSLNIDLKSTQKEISENKQPKSFALNKIKVELNTEVKQVNKTGYNVAGILIGNDPVLKDEYIVIGAHHDHLGMGGDGSLYRGDTPQIHNGADDNASGTTGVLEIAQKLSSIKNKLKRSIIFIGFGGEELGLLGSNHFVNHSPVPTEKMIAMLNMDMIGRMNEDTSLIVYGTGTSKIWNNLLTEHNTYPFKLTFNPEGYGPSDHSSFYSKAIPVLFFFTGTHSDYHRPSDDADKINAIGQEQILKYVYSIVSSIDQSESKPEYVNVPRKEQTQTGGWKVYVGTIPDYAYADEGLKITGVNEGSPAHKSGLRASDIILQFGSKKITNIYDYVYALKEHVPGDIVELKVKRGEENITLTLELGVR
jgi:hypothetical protein